MKKYLTPTEAADLLMVSPITLRSWANKGIIKTATTAGGHRRYSYEELSRFGKENGIDLSSNPSTPQLEKILIVDDEESFAKMLSEYLNLKLKDVETAVARSGFEAGRMVNTFMPSIILMDMNMPDINGCEVCESVKTNEQTSHIRVITMTGLMSEECVEKSMACGAEACIAKPIDIEKLVNLIRGGGE